MAILRPVQRARAVAVAVVVVVSTMVAGCGSEDGGSSAEDDQRSQTQIWADDVCTSVGTWGKTMADVRASLSKPKELSVADLEDIGDKVRTATTTMVADLHAADIPETETGTLVRQKLSQLADQLEHQVQVVKDADVGSADTAGDLLGQISIVAGALATMAADSKAALVDVRKSIDDAELGDAFAKSPACQDLGVDAPSGG